MLDYNYLPNDNGEGIGANEDVSEDDCDSIVENTPETQLSLLNDNKHYSNDSQSPIHTLSKVQHQKSFVSPTREQEKSNKFRSESLLLTKEMDEVLNLVKLESKRDTLIINEEYDTT